MSLRATGTFELEWDEQPPYDDAEGATLATVTITKTWTGDIEATSVTKLIKAMTAEPTSAGLVAVERVTGKVNGRVGSFVLLHNAISDRGDRFLNVVVLPDSGTGELAGIKGTLNVDVVDGAHNVTLDYTLPAE
ncbi:DUF3224 domain-containing protein [Virgisporangium aurantiacum]|uniref:DUF3224 domain-containing protein n=1 Tax=Virgisporangium aurantiacum TaxID=175570 RepID=A0A8J3YZZ7_9ACTN|nr:DUF3224 domain-containing protein [Virgisporangium aurantiacum]GIJ54779.1 hypothetical protein Vau01_022950 [Virgisporangium aurantiacum]